MAKERTFFYIPLHWGYAFLISSQLFDARERENSNAFGKTESGRNAQMSRVKKGAKR